MQAVFQFQSVLYSEDRSLPKEVMKLIILSILILFLVSCGIRSQSFSEPKPEMDVQIALNFINQYTGNLQTHFPALDQAPGMLEWVQAHPDSSDDLKAVLKKMLEEAEKEAPGYGLGFDPILDAQDFPDDNFILQEMDPASGYLTVASPSWEEFKVRMRMKWEKGKWWVDGVGVVNIPEEEQSPR